MEKSIVKRVLIEMVESDDYAYETKLFELFNDWAISNKYWNDSAHLTQDFNIDVCEYNYKTHQEFISYHKAINFSDEYYSYDGYGYAYSYRHIKENKAFDLDELVNYCYENDLLDDCVEFSMLNDDVSNDDDGYYFKGLDYNNAFVKFVEITCDYAQDFSTSSSTMEELKSYNYDFGCWFDNLIDCGIVRMVICL